MIQSLTQQNFKVLIRVRPLSEKEKEEIINYQHSYSKKMKSSTGKMIKLSPSAYSFYTKFYNCNISEVFRIHKKLNTIYVADPEYKNTDQKMKPYTYAGVYDPLDKTYNIFTQDLKSHVSTVLDGYNCTILAYGITGSGKTYTVFGPNKQVEDKSQGICYLTFQHLLKEKQRLVEEEGASINFKLSFIEIYNENARDLLLCNGKELGKNLNIVEDIKGNTTITDVTEVDISNISEIHNYINQGINRRVFASTNANQYSSRSHAILQLTVTKQTANFEKSTAKMYIIDLAGSQKIQTLNCSKKMQEGANINRSLLALGNCINILADNSRKNTVSHIPYRDSKLTRMLKDSLGGNTKTIMIACITPNPFLIEETMTTLNYAQRAQGIQKRILKNSEEIENEYLCLKCKRANKAVEKAQPIESSFNSFDISTLEQLYEDIIANAKENQKLKMFNKSSVCDDPEWLRIKCINEEQGSRLKEILFRLLSYDKVKKQSDFESKKLVEVEKGENKENEESSREWHSSVKSAGGNTNGSKSRRKRSHNKFEVPRKSDELCKTLHFA